MKLELAAIIVIILEARAIAAPSAETLYDQGQVAYDRASYVMAIEKWTQSYELSGAPGLLFNIAQAQRLNGDCAHALSSYRRFVKIDPTSEQRALADDFIVELEPRCDAPTQTPSVDRPNSKPGRTLEIAGFVTSGAGVGLIATGLLFGHRASMLGDEVTLTCAHGCDWGALRGEDARGRRYEKIGYALDAVGLIAIAGGIVMYHLGSKSTVTVAPSTHDNGAIVSWSGSW